MITKSPSRKLTTAFKVCNLNIDILKSVAEVLNDKTIQSALMEAERQMRNAEYRLNQYLQGIK